MGFVIFATGSVFDVLL